MTRSDSVDCLVQDPLTSSEKASISGEDSSEDSIKVVSLHEKETQAMMDVDCPESFLYPKLAPRFLMRIRETDGSVVCISEKKGQDDSTDVERLLEAEKRRLLTEIETGTIFRKKEDVVETLGKNGMDLKWSE
ncbi:hypothetical protein Bca52824_018442 [Brassica carinata]|uniref:Uncharacterized protein n=1 Tax=Brassica carinata TaxID=52824 RepID=A0A8X7VQ45_BRACI|nr:hypothetical protein Bca52824_018442 [Brassica carinata]